MVKDVVPLCKCCHYEAHQNVHRLDKIKRDVLKFYKNNTKKNGKQKKEKTTQKTRLNKRMEKRVTEISYRNNTNISLLFTPTNN